MVLNIIIGESSNLSKHLKNTLDNTHLISSKNIKSLKNINYKNYSNINIIFNQFQISSKLYTLDNPTDYIHRSISCTSEVLRYIQLNSIQINKIVYTSSSSVYGNNISCSERDDVHPLSLHSSLKVANEKLIEKFCNDNKIDYTIARIFNMYGGKDNFSIISKIINLYTNNDTLTLINNGEAIRDFIHIDDVVSAYKQILNTKHIPIVNIGTADGKSILYILDYLRKNDIILKTKNITRAELKVSISENKTLIDITHNNSFKKVEEYILKQIEGSNNGH